MTIRVRRTASVPLHIIDWRVYVFNPAEDKQPRQRGVVKAGSALRALELARIMRDVRERHAMHIYVIPVISGNGARVGYPEGIEPSASADLETS